MTWKRCVSIQKLKKRLLKVEISDITRWSRIDVFPGLVQLSKIIALSPGLSLQGAMATYVISYGTVCLLYEREGERDRERDLEIVCLSLREDFGGNEGSMVSTAMRRYCPLA